MRDFARATESLGAPKSVEGPWELPAGWCWAEAKTFADVIGGGTPKNAADPENFDDAGTPWITPADLSGYTRATIGRGNRSLSKLGFDRTSTALLPPFSLLISSRAPVGYCAVSDTSLCTNQGFKSLRLKVPIDPFFLRYFVLRAKQILNDAASGTTFKELSGRAMEQILFPIAPLAEQRRIVARIDSLFSEIADGEAALAEARKGLDLFRRALLKAAVTGELTKGWRELNPPTETAEKVLIDVRKAKSAAPASRRGRSGGGAFAQHSAGTLPGLPIGWAWTNLENIAETVRNGTSAAPHAGKDDNEILRISAVRPMRVDESQIRHLSDEQAAVNRDATVETGDLLFTRYNGSADFVGVGAIYRGKKRFYPDKIIRVRLSKTVQAIAEYVELAVNSGRSRKHIAANIKTTAGQQGLSGESLKATPIPLPPPDEAAEILRRVSEALAAADDTRKMLDSEAADVVRLKQSILKAAFEGRLVVQDPGDEPASQALARLAPSGKRGGTSRETLAAAPKRH